ncbi:hypothetical protein AAU61_05790 [Desulfocarbo indianensis]|nr:hypothetical protein AAU61_05790 [Desulfocarbo indianensis]
MTRIRIFSAGALAALALIICLAGGAPADDLMRIRDMTGRSLTVPRQPDRVVCLGPGCLRLLAYLQATKELAGIEEMEKRFPTGRPYYMAHPELGGLPTMTPGGVSGINKKPNLEGVLKVRPQVIFATYMHAATAEEVQRLLGIPVVALSYGPLAGFDAKAVYGSLRLAGRIMGQEKRAEAVIAYLEAAQRDLQERARGAAEKPRAYVGGLGFKGAHGIESSDTQYLPFRWLGVENVAKGEGRRTQIFMSKEVLLRLDPEVIFLDGGGLALVTADYAKKPEYYSQLSAFKMGKVFLLHPFNWYTTNLGTALADAYAIGKILYPQRFADIDPARKADAIYDFLVGKPVYREMKGIYGPLGAAPPFRGGDRP